MIPYIVALIVFLIAVLVRLPSCSESLWLDELHSAWSVWGTLVEVAPRAAAGNQTPLYFWGLWFWKQAIGQSEISLRMPSVIASSLAAAIVVIGVVRVRGSLIGGTVAGLVLAIESNSIFYGTELRPFGIVIFLGAVACWLVIKPVKGNDRLPFGLIFIAIFAVALQPTSLGVFGWLVAARMFAVQVFNTTEKQFGWDLRHAIVLLLLAILCAWLSSEVVIEAWQNRTQWNDMGRADGWSQMWRAWPWGPVVLLPALLVFAANSTTRKLVTSTNTTRKLVPQPTSSPSWWTMSVLSLAAVLTFWIISASGLAPVFHRRYFVACLPMLAWACGDALSQALRICSQLEFNKIVRVVIATTIAALPMVTLIIIQGTGPKLATLDMPLIRRGEGWREAVAWLQINCTQDAAVALSPGLIETSRLIAESTPTKKLAAQSYLTFPLSGPYHWSKATAFDWPVSPPEGFQAPLVIRVSRTKVERWLATLGLDDGLVPLSAKIHSFGGVQVVEFSPVPLPTRQY